MRSPRSLGLRSDLIFARFGGEVRQRDDHLVIRTPTNPTFRWGNYLLFDRAPAEGDLQRWCAAFEHEMADLHAALDHRSFAWDAPDGDGGDLRPFVAAGYDVERSVVLTARSVHPPPRPNREVVTRPLASDDDWEQATRNQILCREPGADEAGFSVFKRRQMEAYRRMAGAGLGAWYGAFEGAQLRADLGLFVGDGIGRYQQVCTAPDARRRGLCGTLVHAAAVHAQAESGVRDLVLVAEEGGAPARIYGSVGFELSERLVQAGVHGLAGAPPSG